MIIQSRPSVLPLILLWCPGNLDVPSPTFNDRRLCIVPEMVISVILVDLMLSRIFSSILFGCAGRWLFQHAVDFDCVWGFLQFHLEAPVVTCLLLYLFYCYYICKLISLSSCYALSWPLWLVHCCIVLSSQRFSSTFFQYHLNDEYAFLVCIL